MENLNLSTKAPVINAGVIIANIIWNNTSYRGLISEPDVSENISIPDNPTREKSPINEGISSPSP